MTRPNSGLLELLGEHGVPEKGVRLYLAACRAGPQTASELARLCAVDRVEAYRIIQQLTEAGLLSATGSRPRRFAALPPNELVDRWIRRAADRLRQLEQDRAKILSDWEERRTEVEEGDPRRFAVLEGRETVQRFLKKRLGTAERQVLVSASGPWLAIQIDGGIDRSLKEATARGVKVRVVTEVSPSNLGEAKHYSGFSELRHSSAPVTSRTVVIDHQGALVYVSGEEGFGTTGADQVALWSTSPGFVQLARDYHRRLWSPASRAEQRFVEIESPPAAVLPVVAGRETAPFQRLKEIAKLGMRASGVREFQLDLPEFAEGIARQLGREIAKEVEGRNAAEVAHSLGQYYATHTMGRLAVVRDRPLTIQVTGCFACTSDSPELGRVICPQLLRAVLESRLGSHWEVSKPDPTKHAARGCVFTATSA
jgi:sugar-specific transcriptional regulator TrmB